MARERQATMSGTVKDSPKRTDDLLQNGYLTIIYQRNKEKKSMDQSKTEKKEGNQKLLLPKMT